MLLDISPLRRHRDFRLLFVGQAVSFLGSMVTYVAVPYQVYELTHSSFLVGLLGVAQLIPLFLFGLWGGAYADAMDRRRLLTIAEVTLSAGALLLAVNALLPRPSAVLVFVVAALMSAVNGFHRPALEAMTPRLVTADELPAVAALSGLRGSIGAIVGPTLGGICIARYGIAATYFIDFASFAISLLAIRAMAVMPPSDAAPEPGLRSVIEGLRYARSRPELIGTYVVDIVAMTFAMPAALFPALAQRWGERRPQGGCTRRCRSGAWWSRSSAVGAAVCADTAPPS
ncbi:integral membrane protein [Minicystis rosea]|nr:integral membrane protein [Minicystis rosea]